VHYDIYILLIVNWILLLKDFPHQACWKLFEVWEVTIGRGIKLERTDIVRIEGNDEGCRPPQPTRESGKRCKVPQWGPGQSPGQKRIWFILSVTERVQRMNNATFNSN